MITIGIDPLRGSPQRTAWRTNDGGWRSRGCGYQQQLGRERDGHQHIRERGIGRGLGLGHWMIF